MSDDTLSSGNRPEKRRAYADADNLPLIACSTVSGTAGEPGVQRGQLLAYRRHGKEPHGRPGVVVWVTAYEQRDQPDAPETILPPFVLRVATDAEVEAAGASVTDGMHSDAADTIAYILNAAAQKHARHAGQNGHATTAEDGAVNGGEAGAVDGLYADVENSTLRTVLDQLVAVTPNPDGQYMACCPAHDDRSPSLHVGLGNDGKVLLYCFAGCPYERIISALEGDSKDAQPTRAGCTLEQYAAAKKLEQPWLERQFALEDFVYTSGRTRRGIKIPYFDVTGTDVVATQYRLGLQKPLQGPDTRFKFKAGDKPCLYNLWRLDYAREQKYVVLVEGASDVHALQWHGIPAIGVPGASNWREKRDAPYLQDLERIYVVNEGDAGGAALLRTLRTSILADRIVVVTLPPGYKDASALHIAYPKRADFAQLWNDAIAEAIPLAETERAQRAELAEQALECCKPLAERGDILNVFLGDLAQKGVAGEQTGAQLLYLALTSRVLRRPVNIVVKAVSSAGKSYLVEQILEFFPADAYMLVTAMSDKALIYSQRDYRHIFICIAEASALENEMVSYLIRTLLSEQRLRYHTVEKAQPGGAGGHGGTGAGGAGGAAAGGTGQLEGREIIKEGPTGVIVTTTSVKIHAENETRHLSISIDDSPEQTQRILQKIAQRRYSGEAEAVDLARWRQLQTWIGAAEAEVVVPFAAALMTETKPVAVRLRRDMETVLSLVEAYALLHQQTHRRDALGRVVATLDDYAAVRELVAPIVAEAVEATISTTVRTTVDALAKLYERHVPRTASSWFIIDTSDPTTPTISLEELTAELQLDKSVVSRRVQEARERGFIRNLETRPRQSARLVPGVQMPKATLDVLPSVENVRAAYERAGAASDGAGDDGEDEDVSLADDSEDEREDERESEDAE